MYRFRRLVLTECPQLGHLSITFGNRHTILVAPNGFGRAALYVALHAGEWPHGGSVQLEAAGNPDELLRYSPLIFADELSTFDPLSEVWPRDIASELENPVFLRELGELISECLNADLGKPACRGIPYCGPDTLAVRFGPDGGLLVVAGEALKRLDSGEPDELIYLGLSGSSERLYLRVACLLAMRRHLQMDLPLVAGEIIGLLDLPWSDAVCGLMARYAPQLVVVCGEAESRRIEPVILGSKVINLQIDAGSSSQ